MNKFLPNFWSTILLLILGFLTIVGVVAQIASNPDLYNWTWRQLVMLIVGIFVYFSFSFLGYYYLIARMKNRGICWDEEGIFVDFSNHKIYWYEIEDIHRMYYPGIGKATVISTSVEYGQDIQKRLDKWKSTATGYSFDIFWISVQKSKVMHEQILHEFEQYKKCNATA
ncbi:hypothetical protein [Rummeliibacillus pycnus]|uniref:hypothetical protein n=1 Tax=Rummeliibacillus pycnus TaxID=101070 RepID=UPI003D28694E